MRSIVLGFSESEHFKLGFQRNSEHQLHFGNTASLSKKASGWYHALLVLFFEYWLPTVDTLRNSFLKWTNEMISVLQPSQELRETGPSLLSEFKLVLSCQSAKSNDACESGPVSSGSLTTACSRESDRLVWGIRFAFAKCFALGSHIQ